jgi:integrase
MQIRIGRNRKIAINAKNYLSVGPGDYPCGDNLYLIVALSGGRRWLFRYQRKGVKDSMGLGSARDVTLGDAKRKALDHRRTLANGGDPKEIRDEARRAEACPLFGPYATAWRETYEKSLKHTSSRNKLKHQIEGHCKPLHKMRMDEITTDHIIKLVLDPIRHKVETCRDVRQRLQKIFKIAIGDELRKDNPADYETRIEPRMGKAPKRGRLRGHHKAMSYQDVPAFMHKLSSIEDQSARAIEITLLTVARTHEIQNMRWSQLDLDRAQWDIAGAGTETAAPGETEGGTGTKNIYDKRTPLPRQALAILREMYETRINDYVFPGRDLDGPMSNNTMLKALKEISGDQTLTVHGLRGTFRTWAQDETDFEEEIVEHCMHHITGDDAEEAYKQGQAFRKRRVVLQAWADFATKPRATLIATGRAA